MAKAGPKEKEKSVRTRSSVMSGKASPPVAEKGSMTVAEAGRKGGLTVRDERGHEFYEEIGRKGGHKVRDLIAAGKRALERAK